MNMLHSISLLLTKAFSLLPDSPFSTLLFEINEPTWLAYMNWFLPFNTCLNILLVWVGLIYSYYTFTGVRKIIDKIFDFFK